MCVENGFFPNPITCQEEFFSPLVPNRERKHSPQVFRAIGSVLIVGVNDSFCVAVCIKGVSELLQLFAELLVVIDLSIENNPCSAILIVDRLLAAFHIDDRQAAHAQANSLVEVEAVFIGAAVAYGLTHARKKCLVHGGSVFFNDTYNATHKLNIAGTKGAFLQAAIFSGILVFFQNLIYRGGSD